jgi:hypothetical protein
MLRPSGSETGRRLQSRPSRLEAACLEELLELGCDSGESVEPERTRESVRMLEEIADL